MKLSERIRTISDGPSFKDACNKWAKEVAKLEAELADYKKHFEPQMIQIRLRRQAERNQPRYYTLTGQPGSDNAKS